MPSAVVNAEELSLHIRGSRAERTLVRISVPPCCRHRRSPGGDPRGGWRGSVRRVVADPDQQRRDAREARAQPCVPAELTDTVLVVRVDGCSSWSPSASVLDADVWRLLEVAHPGRLLSVDGDQPHILTGCPACGEWGSAGAACSRAGGLQQRPPWQISCEWFRDGIQKVPEGDQERSLHPVTFLSGC
jgi:hypothetical protein